MAFHCSALIYILFIFCILQMFSPIQIKHECTTIEDVNTSNRINSSDSSLYPFISQDIGYKHRQLSQFWEQTQLSNEVSAKNEIHDQQTMFRAEVNIYIIL